jgi:hypothetical protein
MKICGTVCANEQIHVVYNEETGGGRATPSGNFFSF